jgi:hypothetical protein
LFLTSTFYNRQVITPIPAKTTLAQTTAPTTKSVLTMPPTTSMNSSAPKLVSTTPARIDPLSTIAPPVLWDTTIAIGTSKNANMTICRSVIESADNGYVITGENYNDDGNSDLLLLKTDSQGKKLWDKTYGGPGYDSGNCIIQSDDGGYVIVGSLGYLATSDTQSLWVIKTDMTGNKIWEKTIDGPKWGQGIAIIRSLAGNYTILGNKASDDEEKYGLWLISIDSKGNRLWDKTFFGLGYDYGNSLIQTKEGDYIIIGATNSTREGYGNTWVIKTDSTGNKIWDKTVVDTMNNSGNSIVSANGGGFTIAGVKGFLSTNKVDAWLIKLSDAGEKIWEKVFGGPGFDALASVIQTSDGGFAIVGSTSLNDNTDIWFIKTDTDGNKLWERTFGGTLYDGGNRILQTSDDCYVISGMTQSFGSTDCV